jgi:hypothetical protein
MLHLTRVFALVAVLMALGACSARLGPDTVHYNKPEYCYGDEEIVVENGKTVSSKSVTRCSDDPQKNPLTVGRAGIDPSQCGTYITHGTVHNSDIYGRGVACYIPETDSWEIIY